MLSDGVHNENIRWPQRSKTEFMLLLERGRAEFQIQSFLIPKPTLTQDAVGVGEGREREREEGGGAEGREGERRMRMRI